MAMHAVHVSLPDEIWDDVQREAARLDTTHVQIIRQCVSEEMRRIRLRRIRKELPK